MAHDDPTSLRRWSDLLDDASALPGGTPTATAFRDRYHIQRLIGSGGMGTVYLVQDQVLAREAAMKVCEAGHLDSQLAQRFVGEAQLAARLEHPSILPVYDMGVDSKQRYFFIMRYVQGESLAEVLNKGPLPPARTIEVFLQVCNAIGFAHSQGVLHRDIKPHNILLGPFGETFVIDWGISKLMASGPSSGGFYSDRLQTLSGGIVGTPAYMPPELLDDGARLPDPTTDVYGLGVLLMQLLGCADPFEANTLEGLIEAKKTLRVGKIPKDASRELAAIALKAMSPAPADRYASVAQMVEDVRAAQEHRPGSAWRDSIPTRLVKLARRHRLMAAAAITALLVLAGYHLVNYMALVYQATFQNVSVSTDPGDARVEILRDGAVVDSGGAPFVTSRPLKRGPYRLRCSRQGRQTVERALDVQGGLEVLRVQVVLPLNVGYLSVLPPDPKIELIANRNDAPQRYSAGQSPIALEPGTYRVQMSREGTLERRDQQVEIRYGETTWAFADFSSTRLWSHSQAHTDGGVIVHQPVILSAPSEAVYPVLFGRPGEPSISFVVLDLGTGQKKRELKTRLTESLTKLSQGTGGQGQPILLVSTLGGMYAIDPSNESKDPVKIVGPVDGVAVRGKLFVVGTGGVALVDLESGERRIIEKWTEGTRDPQIVLTDQVTVFHEEGHGCRATAFSATDGTVLWTDLWEGYRDGNVVGADVDGDGVCDWICKLGDFLIARSGKDRSVLWKSQINGLQRWTLIHVRSKQEAGLWMVSTSWVLKISAADGKLLAQREYRSFAPHGPILMHACPVDLGNDFGVGLAVVDSTEPVIRLFDGKTLSLVASLPVDQGYGFVSADVDGDGRGDLLLTTPTSIEAWSPAGSSLTELRTAGLPDQVAVDGAGLEDQRSLVLEATSEAVRLFAFDLPSLKFERGRSLGAHPESVTLGSTVVVARTGTMVTAYDRKDLGVRWQVDLGFDRCTLWEWDDIDKDGVRDLLALQAFPKEFRIAAISGSDGRKLWTRSLEIHGTSPNFDSVDLNGDGIRDLIVHDLLRDWIVCGECGQECVKDAVPKGAHHVSRQKMKASSELVWSDFRAIHRGNQSKELGDSIFGLSLIPDMNGDGVDEVVAELAHDQVALLDGMSLDPIVRLPGRRGWAAGSFFVATGEEDKSGTGSVACYDVSAKKLLWSRTFDHCGSITAWGDARVGVLAVFVYEGSSPLALTVHLMDFASGAERMSRVIGPVGSSSRYSFRPVYMEAERTMYFELYSKLYRVRQDASRSGGMPVWEGDSGADHAYSWRKP